MNVGDPCPQCTKTVFAYDAATLTCKDGHRTGVGVAVAGRPLIAIHKRHVPAGAFLVLGAALAAVVDRV